MFGVKIPMHQFRAIHFSSNANCINPDYELSKFITTILTVLPNYAFDVGSFLNLDYWVTKYLILEKPICEFYNEPFDSEKCNKKISIIHTLIGGLILLQTG